MIFVSLLKELTEAKDKGSAKAKGEVKTKAQKSKVKVYDTIDAALKSGASYGTIFSTQGADRLYVITKPTWGSKSKAGGNTKIAKGFTPGSATPSAKWPSIKAYAVRTMKKHGKQKTKKFEKYKERK